MRKIILSIILLILAAPILCAENLEITIHSGWSFNSADSEFGICRLCLAFESLPPFENITTNAVDNSVMIGIKAAYFLNQRAGIEGSFSVSPNHDVLTQSTFVCREGPCPYLFIPDVFLERNMVAYQYDANFLYNLLAGDVEPYLTIGVGGVASDLDNDVRNDFAFNFGGGGKFWFKKVGLRFELNDHVIPNYFFSNKTEHNLQVQYGFVFKL